MKTRLLVQLGIIAHLLGHAAPALGPLGLLHQLPGALIQPQGLTLVMVPGVSWSSLISLPTQGRFSVYLAPTHILNDSLTSSFPCLVTDRAFTNGRVQHPPRSSMPRIHAGPRVSSLPPRQWAGVPLSWCKCHCHQSGERMAECCRHHRERTRMVGRCSSPSLLSHSDAADLVVQGKGTFEELMVCSREIAASTAQLVAASKVGARLLPYPCLG